MPRRASSRKYQLTINNPLEHEYSHECLKNILNEYSNIVYWCMCDEIGENKTLHTHIYIVFSNQVMFTTLQKRFYGAHFEAVNGSHQANRDYLRKEGKWQNSEKKETNLIETFEEFGVLPPESDAATNQSVEIYEMVKNGASNFDITERYPNSFKMLDKIDRVRQMFLEEQNKDTYRKLEVTYIWGKTRVGKTRSVLEKYGYSNVFRIPNYTHPFDGYKGQDVILFDEFRSSLPISDMLKYLEGYPVELPCRYANRQACFTKVYLISNIPLEKQYPNVQSNDIDSWDAFKGRFTNVICKLPPGSNILNWSDDEYEDEELC